MRNTIAGAALAAALWAGPATALECTSEPVAVAVVQYESNGALRDAYLAITGEHRRVLRGFATFNTRTGVHTLHVHRVRHRRSAAVTTLGHELLHAVCGDWHPDTPE